MNTERMKVIILGKDIGTADGWDTYCDHGVQFSGFISTIPEIQCDVFCIDFETGSIDMFDAEDNELPSLTTDYFLTLIIGK